MTIKLVIPPQANMPILLTETEFQEFRGQLHKQFRHRADSTMDLLDALYLKSRWARNKHYPKERSIALHFSELYKICDRFLNMRYAIATFFKHKQ